MINHQIPSQRSISLWCSLAVDMIFLNLLLFTEIHFLPSLNIPYVYITWNLSFLIAFFILPPLAIIRLTRADFVMLRSFYTSLLMFLLFMASNFILKNLMINNYHLCFLLLGTIITLLLSRYIDMMIATALRFHNKDNCDLVFVGAGVNIKELYNRIVKNPGSGYNVHGYFENKVSNTIGDMLPRLGDVNQFSEYIKSHKVDMVICNLDQSRAEEITEIINNCENNLVKFYSVLNTQNYMHRAMTLQFIDTIPLITMRNEPLTKPFNRLLKRIFDIAVSFVAIILLSPLMLVVACIIKCSSKGPVFFVQERTGKNGKNFKCFKFRSMKVNDDADKIQATKDDPRKYPFGDFMRKTNIDEIPQFFNVLFGTMSIVGPRPHMLAHTDQYSQLIDKYMVRHYAMPGITGWAQVTGSRGETKEIWQMEERIQKDIWYLENWSLSLDIRIIWRTIINVIFKKEQGNAY